VQLWRKWVTGVRVQVSGFREAVDSTGLEA
jgi:hypothetical protein